MVAMAAVVAAQLAPMAAARPVVMVVGLRLQEEPAVRLTIHLAAPVEVRAQVPAVKVLNTVLQMAAQAAAQAAPRALQAPPVPRVELRVTTGAGAGAGAAILHTPAALVRVRQVLAALSSSPTRRFPRASSACA